MNITGGAGAGGKSKLKLPMRKQASGSRGRRSFLQPNPFDGAQVTRTEPCRLCGGHEGTLIGMTDYWDLRRSSIVICERCKLIQLDPMLTEPETAKGCLAYYIEESLRRPVEEQQRDLLRNFRRGVLFGYSLKRRHIKLREVLELGPGSGYFAQGLQFVYPAVRITVADINHEVLQFNRDQHQYKTIHGTPEKFFPEFEGSFDLIIARDILEHVTDIGLVLSNIRVYLKPGGFFHFLTPNGREDVWKHYLTWHLRNRQSELLINHVNYFDSSGLKEHLLNLGFRVHEFYMTGIKPAIRGQGRLLKPSLTAPVTKSQSTDYFISERRGDLKPPEADKKTVLDHWYLSQKCPLITYLVSRFYHGALIKIDPALNVGHEIHGLFQKAGLDGATTP
jgi:2-polyprenyl-3-methyl-5-hydroxy-6-metoxy-1,4-benzoquinol methylase